MDNQRWTGITCIIFKLQGQPLVKKMLNSPENFDRHNEALTNLINIRYLHYIVIPVPRAAMPGSIELSTQATPIFTH